MVQIWSEELLRYHFSVIHQSEKMMGGVDALTRRFGEKLSVYLFVVNILRNKDELKHPDSYDDAVFVKKSTKTVEDT